MLQYFSMVSDWYYFEIFSSEIILATFYYIWELIIYLFSQRNVRSWPWRCKLLGSPPGWYRVTILRQVRSLVGADLWGKAFKVPFSVSPKEMGHLLDWGPLQTHHVEPFSFFFFFSFFEREILLGHMYPRVSGSIANGASGVHED